jgi:prefoldin alpha subunit
VFGSQDLMMQYELIRQEINGIDEQIKQLQQHHSELNIALEGINGLGGAKELFVPGGAGVYFNASLVNDESCLVSVGAGVIIEMDLVKAEKTIKDRMEQALSMIVKLNSEAEQMVLSLQQIEGIIQAGQQA